MLHHRGEKNYPKALQKCLIPAVARVQEPNQNNESSKDDKVMSDARRPLVNVYNHMREQRARECDSVVQSVSDAPNSSMLSGMC